MGPRPFTVFVSTNEAIAALPAGTVAPLPMAENEDKLVEVLTDHGVAGRVLQLQRRASAEVP